MSADDKQQLFDILQKLRLIDQSTTTEDQFKKASVFIPAGGKRASQSLQRNSMGSSELTVRLNQGMKNQQHQMDQRVETAHHQNSKKVEHKSPRKAEDGKVDNSKINPRLSTTMNKIQSLKDRKRRFPVSKYDIATG